MQTHLRILYVNVINLHAGWGAEWFVDRGFRTAGHQTYCIDYIKNRHRLTRHFWNAPPCDVFFLQRGDGFPLPLLKLVQIPRFFWASELVSRCRDQDRLLRSNLFNHVFLRTPTCVATVIRNGWLHKEQCSILLSGFDPAIHRRLPVKRDIDVLFVGSPTPRRAAFLNTLRRHHKIVVATAFGEELVRLFNRAKIVLNIHAEDFLDTETRVFEVLGCGAFLLTELLSEENPFDSGDLVQVSNMDTMSKKIHYFLTHKMERERIAAQGYHTAHTAHTYAHRAAHIANVMDIDRRREDAIKTPVQRGIQLLAYGMIEPCLKIGHASLFNWHRVQRRFQHLGISKNL